MNHINNTNESITCWNIWTLAGNLRSWGNISENLNPGETCQTLSKIGKIICYSVHHGNHVFKNISEWTLCRLKMNITLMNSLGMNTTLFVNKYYNCNEQMCENEHYVASKWTLRWFKMNICHVHLAHIGSRQIVPHKIKDYI